MAKYLFLIVLTAFVIININGKPLTQLSFEDNQQQQKHNFDLEQDLYSSNDGVTSKTKSRISRMIYVEGFGWTPEGLIGLPEDPEMLPLFNSMRRQRCYNRCSSNIDICFANEGVKYGEVDEETIKNSYMLVHCKSKDAACQHSCSKMKDY